MAETSNTPSNTVIQIRRSNVNAKPKSLANGELAYSFLSDRFFIGKTETPSSAPEVTFIGGKIIVDKVANLESVVASLSEGTITQEDLIVDKLTFSSYTPNSMLFVKENGEVDFLSGNEGEVLQIVANGSPDFGGLDGGIY